MNLTALFRAPDALANPSRAEVARQWTMLTDLVVSVRRAREGVTPAVQRALDELGLSWPTTSEAVQDAYRRAVRVRHPDANRGVDRGVQQALEAKDTLLRALQ